MEISEALKIVGTKYVKNDFDAGRVMVFSPGTGKRARKLKLYKDSKGFYVRTGKRGSCRVNLSEMRKAMTVSYITMPVFYE